MILRKYPGRTVAILLLLLGLPLACTTKRSVEPHSNRPPETHLFLQFADTLQYPGETTSMQVLFWFGDDPDGEVIGYEWAWDDTSQWAFTTSVTDTFFVPITVPQDTFTFYIRALDDGGLKDPTPDHISFPIRNSPPTVSFPLDFIQRYARVTYECFSYFSINWSSSDLDGDATITGFNWYLADSSFNPWTTVGDSVVWDSVTIDTMSWNHLDSLTTIKIFNDLEPGGYRLFLRCRDVADAYSNIVFYPDTVAGATWNVLPVVGTVLFVDDDLNAPTLDSIIPASLAMIYPGGFSTWNVIDRISYSPRDIEETLKLFDKVVWHGGSRPHFKEAADAITSYVGAGGNILAFSTQAQVGYDTVIYAFLPIGDIDTTQIGRAFKIIRAAGAQVDYPDTLWSPNWPLGRSFGFTPGPPSGLIPRPAEALYTQAPDANPALVDTVAARFPAYPEAADIIYFSMELFACQEQFYDLLSFILEVEFASEGF